MDLRGAPLTDDCRVAGRDVADVRTSLQNNAVFAEYPRSGKVAHITIERRDGSESSVDVQLEPNTSNFADLHLLRAKARARR